jgi:hypothetical protein
MNLVNERATMISNTIQPRPGAVTILANNNRTSSDSSRAYRKKKVGGGSKANANTLSDAYWKTRVIQFIGEQNGSVGPNLIGKYLSLQPPSSVSSSDSSHAANSSLLAEIKARHGSLVAWMRGHADTFLLEKVPSKEHEFVVHLIVGQSKNIEVVSVSDKGDDSRETEHSGRIKTTNGEKQDPPLSVASRSTALYWMKLVRGFLLRKDNTEALSGEVGRYLNSKPPSSVASSQQSALQELKEYHGNLASWVHLHTDELIWEPHPTNKLDIMIRLILEQSKNVEVVSVSGEGDDSRETEQPRRRKTTNGEKQNPPSSVVSRSTSLHWMKLVQEFLLQNDNTEASSGEVGSYLQSQPPSSAGFSQDARRAQSALQELKECHGNLASWVHLHTDELVWEQHPMNKDEFMIRLVKGRLRPETTSTAAKSISNSKTTAITNVERSKDQATTITQSSTLSSQSDRDSYWKSFVVRFLARNLGATTTATGTTTREIGLYLTSLPSSDGRSTSALAEFKKENPSLTFWLQQQPELFVVELIAAVFAVHLTERGMVQALRDAARADIAEKKTRMHPNLPKVNESNQQSATASEPPVTGQAQRELGKKENQLRQPQEALSVLKAALEKAENERDDALRLLDLAKRAHHDTMQTAAYEKDEKERLQLLWGDTRNQLGREKETCQNLRSELDGTIERLASTIISREVLQNRLSSEQIVRKEVEAEVLKLTNQLVRKQDNGGSSRLVRVRNELQQTQDKLAREKEKNRSAIAQTQEVKEAKFPELSDWMGALDVPVRVMQRSDVPMRVPEPTVTEPTLSLIPAPLEAPNCAAPEPTTQDRESKINFGGLDDSDDAGKDVLDRLDAELTFVMSSYGGDELHATNSAVVRLLNLNVDQDSTVRVNLTLTIPEGYPASGTLDIKAEIDNASTSGSAEARKFVSDYLLFLVNVCQWEANVCLGDEAMLTVLTTADQWVQNEWAGIRTKHLGEKYSQKSSEGARTFEICRLLVYSHHITEPEKIQLLKSSASKSGIGGFVRIGRPGFVLAEGLEENCDNFLASIVQQRKKQREKGMGKVDSAYFTQAGKVLATVSDFEAGRSFSKKIAQLEGADSLDELKQICGQVGLAESLEEACKR